MLYMKRMLYFCGKIMINMKNNYYSRKSNSIVLLCCLLVFAFSVNGFSKNVLPKVGKQWSEEKAQQWYARQPWLVGCDYIPATAINQIEMWHKDSFDPKQIDKELGWAENIGFNTLRVFLSSAVWMNDSQGMKKRMNEFLSICNKHKIRPFFVFFDDCWNAVSSYGKQPLPKPGVHNSGWVQDPSYKVRKDSLRSYPQLRAYVQDIVNTFKNDKRVLMWDLYNEAGNSNYKEASLPLLRNVFRWARACNPTQPLTAGVYHLKDPALYSFILRHSDIITYHSYDNVKEHASLIRFLKMMNRPLICTEYMARKFDSRFQNILPLLKKENVGAVNWGFVSGKTNTMFAWSNAQPNVKEPELWFHDVFRQDGTPFSKDEIDTIKKLTGRGK